jgi:small subunit ribosomal protein S20
MPNTKSAKKELRKNAKQKAYNKEIKNNVKSLIKQSKKAIMAKEDNARDLVSQTLKALDKSVQKGVLKENSANRKKSRIHKLLNKEMSEEKSK